MHSTLSSLTEILLLIVLASGLGGMIAITRLVRLKIMALDDEKISRLRVSSAFVRVFVRILAGAVTLSCLVFLIGVFGIAIFLVVSR